MRIHYTTEEGGLWNDMYISLTKEVAIRTLNRNLQVSAERSVIFGELVHSVRFPDGDIWDSTLTKRGIGMRLHAMPGITKEFSHATRS